MKKKLLYLTSIVLFSVLSVSAQKTWDFSADATYWPLNDPGVTSSNPVTTIQEDLLNQTSHTSSGTYFGVVSSSVTTFTADGFVTAKGFKTGGTGSAVNNLPSVRFLSFNVSGACTVKVWTRHGSATVGNRTVFVTGGTSTSLYGSATVTETGGATPNAIVNATVTAAGPVYVYADNGVWIYKIEVIGATVNTPALSTDAFQAESSVVVYANDGAINVSNVTSATKVSVYSVLGSLVKSIETSEDTSVAINAGVYVVKAQSAEGTKTTKVIVQ